MNPFFFVLGTIVATACGQIFIKAGIITIKNHSPSMSSWMFLTKALTHPAIIAGLVLAFLAAIFWIFAMRSLPLSFAYPFTALTIFAVTFLSATVFKEPLPSLVWVSLGFVLIGLSILSFSR